MFHINLVLLKLLLLAAFACKICTNNQDPKCCGMVNNLSYLSLQHKLLSEECCLLTEWLRGSTWHITRPSGALNTCTQHRSGTKIKR